MLELRTMFISLDIDKIWRHSAGVWRFSFCYSQQPSKVEKWELLFSCQLPHWTSASTRLCENGGIFADMCSVNSVFHHFEQSIPVHLQHALEEGSTGFHCPHAFMSCTQAQAEHPHGTSCLTQLQNNPSRRAQLHKEGRSYAKNTLSVASSSPSIITWGNPGSWLQLNIF